MNLRHNGPAKNNVWYHFICNSRHFKWNDDAVVPHRKPFSFIYFEAAKLWFRVLYLNMRMCLCVVLHSFNMLRIRIQIRVLVYSDLNCCVLTIEIHAQLHIPCIILFWEENRNKKGKYGCDNGNKRQN